MRFLIVVTLIGIYNLAFPQPDTIYVLDSIVVFDSTGNLAIKGGSSQTIVLDDFNQLPPFTIADAMEGASSVFIKNYGPGTLSTLALRGGTASHTKLTWNGIPVESPMLGQLDLSLLPATFFDKMQIMRGGNSTVQGSGSVSGTINLITELENERKLQVFSEIGSFANQRHGLSMTNGGRAWHGQTRFIFSKGKNNFPYMPITTLPARRLKNASINQKGIMQSFRLELTERKNINVHLWNQSSVREIPPLLTQSRSTAKQDDDSFRMVMSYENNAVKRNEKYRIAFFNVTNKFRDPEIRLSSRNHFTSFIGSYTGDFKVGEETNLILGTNHNITRAHTLAYEKAQSEYQNLIFATAEITRKKLKVRAGISSGWAGTFIQPVLPFVNLEYYLDKWTLGTKLSRNFRLPSLNDRYWIPGGNPTLKPEGGWSEEIRIVFKHRGPTFSIANTNTVFNRRIKNWILWSRSPSNNFWSAQNLGKVWSRGIEWNAQLRYLIAADFSIRLDVKYSYILSTSQQKLDVPEIRRGQQLFYIPKSLASALIAIKFKSLETQYDYRLTGSFRGINENLEGYRLGLVRFSFLSRFWGNELLFYFRLNNVWNTDYLIIENRPMPGRNIQAGVKIRFGQND